MPSKRSVPSKDDHPKPPERARETPSLPSPSAPAPADADADALVDEASEESFPASDPPAHTPTVGPHVRRG